MKQTTGYRMPSKQKFGPPFHMMQTRRQLKRAFSVAENTQPEIMDEQYSPSVDTAYPNWHQLQPSQEETMFIQEPSPRRQLKRSKTVYESTQPEIDEQCAPSMDLFPPRGLQMQPGDKKPMYGEKSFYRRPLKRGITFSESESTQPALSMEKLHHLPSDGRATHVPQMPLYRGWLKRTKTISESEGAQPDFTEQHVLNNGPPYGLYRGQLQRAKTISESQSTPYEDEEDSFTFRRVPSAPHIMIPERKFRSIKDVFKMYKAKVGFIHGFESEDNCSEGEEEDEDENEEGNEYSSELQYSAEQEVDSSCQGNQLDGPPKERDYDASAMMSPDAGPIMHWNKMVSDHQHRYQYLSSYLGMTLFQVLMIHVVRK